MPVFSSYGLTRFPAFVHQQAYREWKSLTQLNFTEKSIRVLVCRSVANTRETELQNTRKYLYTYVREQVFRKGIDTSSAEPIRPTRWPLNQHTSKQHRHEILRFIIPFASLIFVRSINRSEAFEKTKVSLEFDILLEALVEKALRFLFDLERLISLKINISNTEELSF